MHTITHACSYFMRLSGYIPTEYQPRHGMPEGEVMVFDSLYDSMPPTTAEQVCALVHTPAQELTMLFANVKKQHNRSDCGVFAIAYATSLCHGVNPVTTQYTGRKMRDYLRRCLLLGEITPFPSRHTSPLDTVRSCQIVEVVCHCRTQPECPMLQCSACQEVYHEQCEDFPKSFSNNEAKTWKCRTCKNSKD